MIENHFDYNITREKICKAFDVKPGHPAYAPICAFLDYYDKEIREQYALKRNLEMGYWNFISKYVYNKLLKFEYDTADFAIFKAMSEQELEAFRDMRLKEFMAERRLDKIKEDF
ncbi:MAG: hypothetical protein J6V44_13465 [Methanobrevibacter sp.]|nr:hypothetical protein [Methanobrevibacter sp.]